MMFSQKLNSHRIFKRLAKALIRLRVCAGCSEPLLVAHTTLLEIPCHGSNYIFFSERKKKCVPTLSKIFKTITQNTFFIWPEQKFVKEITGMELQNEIYDTNFSFEKMNMPPLFLKLSTLNTEELEK